MKWVLSSYLGFTVPTYPSDSGEKLLSGPALSCLCPQLKRGDDEEREGGEGDEDGDFSAYLPSH